MEKVDLLHGQKILTLKLYNRAGFKKIESGGIGYFVLEEVFKNEICQGIDWKKAAKLLVARGFLLPSTDHKSTRTENLPGLGKLRCYRFIKIPSNQGRWGIMHGHQKR